MVVMVVLSGCVTTLYGTHLRLDLADAEEAAAGSIEDLAVDPAGVVRSQEGDDVSDVGGSADQSFISVSVKPGATALTLIFRSPRSQARVRVRVLIAPLVMVYMVAM